MHAQSARRRRALYNALGVPAATNEDAVAVLRRCRRLYSVYYGIFIILRRSRIALWTQPRCDRG